jgi:hypothetical protein
MAATVLDVVDSSVCIVIVAIKDRADPRIYFRDADEYDFLYSRPDLQYIIVSLADLKSKKGGEILRPLPHE